jgi:hypothetical protein
MTIDCLINFSENFVFNETITDLRLDVGYKYRNIELGMKAFCDSLSQNKSLKSLDFNCWTVGFLSHSGLLFDTILSQKSLKSFSISNTMISMDCFLKFFKELENNESLTCLKMNRLILFINILK